MKNTYHIKGMHCKSCEILLESAIKNLNGVKQVDVSHKEHLATVYSDFPISEERISETVKECGYEIVKDHEEAKVHTGKKNSFDDYMEIAIISVLILFLAFVLGKLEIARYFPDIGNDAGIAIAFVLGLVASVSTCLVLLGGIVMSLGEMYPVQEEVRHPFLAKAKPHIYFHIGRIGGFIILGGLLGLIGSKINYSISFTGYLTMVVALVMFYIGLQILKIVPNISKLGFHLPKFLSNKIHTLRGSNHYFAPVLIGVLTFFLPCGFTQSMQLAAVASQSFLSGALIMGAFAVGTMPVLISLGIGSTFAKERNFSVFNKFIGVIIVFFAFYSFNSGLILSGSSFNLKFWESKNTASAVIQDDVQIVKMNVDYGYDPSEFKIKKDIPVRFIINGVNVSGCSRGFVIPSLGIQKTLSEGENIVEFTPKKSGILPFSCSMGMISGRFIVE